MRWYKPIKVIEGPNDGDIRTIKRFAFFPTRIYDHLIWFESYYATQEYCMGEFTIPDRWVTLEFKLK